MDDEQMALNVGAGPEINRRTVEHEELEVRINELIHTLVRAHASMSSTGEIDTVIASAQECRKQLPDIRAISPDALPSSEVINSLGNEVDDLTNELKQLLPSTPSALELPDDLLRRIAEILTKVREAYGIRS